MASVWVAREWSPSGARQRLVAVKAMLPELARQPDFRSMFLEEGQIVRSIDHPNVVKVFEVAEDRSVLYMAMEWVEGDSLRAVIKEAKRRRAIPPEMAVRIIADTAAGLHAAHELRGWDGELRNLVHCDISPHNILVGLDGQAKLVDFGVANATVHSEFGTNDKIKGKFAYMSPEQAQAQKIDRRSDIFALGIVLYELTTGERLFRGDNAAHTLKLVTSAKIPDPREVNEKYPEKLAVIVKKALERDVAKRYQTADELRAALEKYLVEERILVSTASVGQLVRRVLGTRIEHQRVVLREALIAADGMLHEGLVPNQPAGNKDFSTPDGEPYRASGSHPSPLSDPPTGSHTSGTSAPFQQTMDTPAPRRRSALGGLLFAAFGVAAAVGAVVFAGTKHKQNELISSGSDVAKVAQADQRGAGTPSGAEATGVDISSIPLAGQIPPGAAGQGKAGKGGKKEAEGELPDNPYLKAKETKEAKEAKEKDPEKDPVAAPEPETEIAPIAPAAPEPPGEAGPFSKGAAMAQLGGAMNRAAGCKRPDGPTGGGRVSVTFATTGSVSNVAVPAPFAGTPVGSCLSSVYKNLRVPAFTGSPVTLPASFRIPD
jgi:eukaryotic-like serine/threonine-protein kinase